MLDIANRVKSTANWMRMKFVKNVLSRKKAPKRTLTKTIEKMIEEFRQEAREEYQAFPWDESMR